MDLQSRVPADHYHTSIYKLYSIIIMQQLYQYIMPAYMYIVMTWFTSYTYIYNSHQLLSIQMSRQYDYI